LNELLYRLIGSNKPQNANGSARLKTEPPKAGEQGQSTKIINLSESPAFLHLEMDKSFILRNLSPYNSSPFNPRRQTEGFSDVNHRTTDFSGFDHPWTEYQFISILGPLRSTVYEHTN